MTWLPLSKATGLIDHDVQNARERLLRAISKSWQTRGIPQPALDLNVPLRMQVTPPAGFQVDGRDWLEKPSIDWECSEIECLCRLWSAKGHSDSAAPTQCRARIEVWDEDLVRLCSDGTTIAFLG